MDGKQFKPSARQVRATRTPLRFLSRAPPGSATVTTAAAAAACIDWAFDSLVQCVCERAPRNVPIPSTTCRTRVCCSLLRLNTRVADIPRVRRTRISHVPPGVYGRPRAFFVRRRWLLRSPFYHHTRLREYYGPRSETRPAAADRRRTPTPECRRGEYSTSARGVLSLFCAPPSTFRRPSGRTVERVTDDVLQRRDGRPRREMAEGGLRPELRLHVQTVDHRQQQRGQDVVLVPVRRRQFHVRVRVHGRHRFQSEDRVQARQTSQAPDLGEYTAPVRSAATQRHGSDKTRARPSIDGTRGRRQRKGPRACRTSRWSNESRVFQITTRTQPTSVRRYCVSRRGRSSLRFPGVVTFSRDGETRKRIKTSTATYVGPDDRVFPIRFL